uniref:Uncharacterized protein n=1 Tax=Rhodnius prolixus TaxID=13249 RepID=T1HRE8_RHOPR
MAEIGNILLFITYVVIPAENIGCRIAVMYVSVIGILAKRAIPEPATLHTRTKKQAPLTDLVRDVRGGRLDTSSSSWPDAILSFQPPIPVRPPLCLQRISPIN